MAATTIQRVLVANRGEIARRVFRTCRRLGISTVAVVSDTDADAPFAREADAAYRLGGRTPAESYLRAEAILRAAHASGADAIHPGYGFLSENADFAQAVLDAGLIWIGPSPEAIRAMGSKTEARTRMQAAGVPVLPGSYDPGDASEIGFPLLVKASAGGGGKGMRRVDRPESLAAAVDAARREAGAAFGDPTVFLERYAPESRHVEVQIVGDRHGRVVAFGERDCSIQRRHQKVIEESPSPAVDAPLRERLLAAAVTAGEAIGYVGAGTVEFLLVDSEFFFLEVNTRLQVEHPVTELVYDVDLVELQLDVAEGKAVPDCPAPRGWAVEARLYAEDPANDFLPVAGRLTRFSIPGGVRVDTGVEGGSDISPFYDPMIAKVIAHGPTRDAAIRKLADALTRARVHGITTNRDFLVRVLRHPEFLGGGADTAFLARHPAADLAAPLVGPEQRRLALLAAALAAQAARREGASSLASIPSGWRNNPTSPQRQAYELAGEPQLVEYRLGRDGSTLELPADVELVSAGPDMVRLTHAGLTRTYVVQPAGDGTVSVSTHDGEIHLRALPRFKPPGSELAVGSLQSPMPGTVLRVDAVPGTDVRKGQVLLVLEAMKMEHEIVAPRDGLLTTLSVASGDQVTAGAVLAVIEDAEPA